MSNILVIPDTQVREGDDVSHLKALGNYAVTHFPDYVIHLGDHWDMHSLSSYDIGKLAAEGARYDNDIVAGIKALEEFDSGINAYNEWQRTYHKKQYNPRKIFLLGNHENRVVWHVSKYPNLEGKLSYKDFRLEEMGWEVYPFLEVINILDVYFSHYFVNPDSLMKKPFSSTPEYQLKSLGHSFVYGHQPGLRIASPRYTSDGRVIRGIVAGSFYTAHQEYQGPQGQDYWRGALMLHDVDNGMFRLEELPLPWLIENYL